MENNYYSTQFKFLNGERSIGQFQNDVNKIGNPNNQFSIDIPHAGKPAHVHSVEKFGFGADNTQVDFRGKIIGSGVNIGGAKMKIDTGGW